MLAAVLLAAARTAQGAAAAAPAGLAEAQQRFDAGDFQGAISVLRGSAAEGSPDAGAHFLLGRSYYEMRDYDNAVTESEKSVALAPKNALYHQWLGRAYGGKADRDRSFFMAKKVKAEFEAAVKLDPTNLSARRDLEEYCLSAPWIVGGSKEEALAQVAAIAAVDPVEGYLARATYDMDALKKTAEAEAEYEKVIEAKPKSIEAYFEAASFFVAQNQVAGATKAIEAAAEVNPNDPRLGYYRGVTTVLSSGDATGAEQELKSYIASTPDWSDWPSHAAAREWLGRLYESQGRVGSAAEQYRAALQLEPGRRGARDRLNKLGKGLQ